MDERAQKIREMSRSSRLNPEVAAPSTLERGAPSGAASSGRTNCPICDEDISARARKCRHCGEVLDPTLRTADEGYGSKSKILAFALAWVLGGLGGHKFYLGRVAQGVLYLVFCWTFIPALLGFIEGIVYLTMDDERFAEKYG